MTPKKNRITERTADKIFRQGQSVYLPTFSFKFLREKSVTPPKISVVVPKNVAKLAVKRNALRRRGYSVLSRHLAAFPNGILGLLIFKKYEERAEILENEIRTILTKIN